MMLRSTNRGWTRAFCSYLHRLHRADDHHSFSNPSSKATKESSLAVQFAALVAHLITEELKHPEPETAMQKSQETFDERENGQIQAGVWVSRKILIISHH